MRQQKPASL